MAFKQNGRLLKRWPEPRYTRVSAALFLTEHEEEGQVTPRALIIHNPNAESPLPREMWLGIPDFFSKEITGVGRMKKSGQHDRVRGVEGVYRLTWLAQTGRGGCPVIAFGGERAGVCAPFGGIIVTPATTTGRRL
jgi:hypothetical protein